MYVCISLLLRFFLLTAFYISKQHHEQKHSAPALIICASKRNGSTNLTKIVWMTRVLP